MKRLILAFSLVLAVATPAFAATPTILSEGPAEQMLTRSMVLRSHRMGRDFVITVFSPPAPMVAARKLPVVYALDDGLGLVNPVGQFYTMSGVTAPTIVVTIGYRPADYRFRNEDLLHRPVTVNGRQEGGRGGLMEAFLKEDLRPLIEAKYPVDPAKAVLFGHSYAGTFAANILGHDPGAFAGYLIASPLLTHDSDALAAIASSAARGAGRTVYLTAGGSDLPGVAESLSRLQEALGAAGSTWTVKGRVFPGANHGSYLPTMLAEALPVLPPLQR